MTNYYDEKLNSDKLFKVYETNIPRVKDYLDSEIEYVLNSLTGNEEVLELGAGYGRIMKKLAPKCKTITGIDISESNVFLGNEYLKENPNARIAKMDVHNLELDKEYDVILCLQNGLSAMKGDLDTIKDVLKYLKPGGKAFFSSYSEKFWDHRVLWFKEQADKGLLGEIDLEKTKDGKIVCKDGFIATTHSVDDFHEMGKALNYTYEIKEVKDSSLFFVVTKK